MLYLFVFVVMLHEEINFSFDQIAFCGYKFTQYYCLSIVSGVFAELFRSNISKSWIICKIIISFFKLSFVCTIEWKFFCEKISLQGYTHRVIRIGKRVQPDISKARQQVNIDRPAYNKTDKQCRTRTTITARLPDG